MKLKAVGIAAPLTLFSIGWCGPARAEPIDVPINVGVGPAGFMLNGAAGVAQPLYYGVKLDMAAIIDQSTIARYKNRIPAQYQAIAQSVGEARVGMLYIPDALILSPGVDSSFYGATWRPVNVGIGLLQTPRLEVGAGLVGTIAYLTSRRMASPTVFIRPGVDLGASLEFSLNPAFHLKLGWDQQAYIPQKLGGAITELGSGAESLWLMGQPYLELDFRFPYRANI